MTAVDFEPLSLAIPLREDPPGVFRVGRSRVLLELVILAFKQGETPEAIVQAYDTLTLPEVYAVVSHYLANPAPFERYLHDRDQAAADVRRRVETAQGERRNLRALVLGRAKAKGLLDDQAR